MASQSKTWAESEVKMRAGKRVTEGMGITHKQRSRMTERRLTDTDKPFKNHF